MWGYDSMHKHTTKLESCLSRKKARSGSNVVRYEIVPFSSIIFSAVDLELKNKSLKKSVLFLLLVGLGGLKLKNDLN